MRVVSIKLALVLFSMIALLAWIGWRYFIKVPQKCGSAEIILSPLRAMYNGKLFISSRHAPCVCRLEKRRFEWTSLKWFRHWSLWLMPLLAVLPMFAVFALSEQISLAPLELINFNWQSRIQSALRTEKLVPPPPMPPSLFINTVRPELETANRDWNRFDPGFMQRALLVFERVHARGYPIVLLEGYRSPERQDMLFNSNAHLTKARAYESKHQFGLALDAAPVKDGKLMISETDSWAMQAYQVLGEEAEKAGLIWGGRWRLQDYGHIESTSQTRSDSKR
jgi:peptidoglycan L-alanyl-D-glutamate endopeptidase CwlK